MVRSAVELFELHQRAVGGNCTFLLNVPPTRAGRIAEPDRRSLLELGRLLEQMRASAVTTVAELSFSSAPLETEAERLLAVETDETSPWSPDAGDSTPWVEIALSEPTRLAAVSVDEQIRLGQRIERVRLSGWDGQQWLSLAEARSVGYRRTWRLHSVRIQRLRLEILASRGRPTIARIALFCAENGESGAGPGWSMSAHDQRRCGGGSLAGGHRAPVHRVAARNLSRTTRSCSPSSVGSGSSEESWGNSRAEPSTRAASG